MAASEAAEIVSQAWPFVGAAIARYSAAVLRDSEESAADATVSLGRRILKRVFGRGEASGALADLAQDPDDADLQAALRVELRRLLVEDGQMADQVRRILREAPSSGGITSNVVRDSTLHGAVVQAGTITGDINIGPAGP